MLLFGNPQPAADAIFQTNVRARKICSVYFRYAFPEHLRLGLDHFNAGEHITFIFAQAPRDVIAARVKPKRSRRIFRMARWSSICRPGQPASMVRTSSIFGHPVRAATCAAE